MDRLTVNAERVATAEALERKVKTLAICQPYETDGWRRKSLDAAIARMREAVSLLVPPHGLDDA